MLHFTCLDFQKKIQNLLSMFSEMSWFLSGTYTTFTIFVAYSSGLFICADSSRRHRSLLTSNDEAVNIDQSVPEIIYYNTWKALSKFGKCCWHCHCPQVCSVSEVLSFWLVFIRYGACIHVSYICLGRLNFAVNWNLTSSVSICISLCIIIGIFHNGLLILPDLFMAVA
jgi:hypothetical protein